MNKKDWLLVISAVPAIWLMDILSKLWALKYVVGLKFWGPFGLVLHRNKGAMLGMFSDLPPILRIVSLSTGGAFLVFIYAAIQYLIPNRSFRLRLGMSLLLGGILGNVTDRIAWGSVVDFLLIGWQTTEQTISTPAFNVADAIQWVGYILIVISLVKDGNVFWPEYNTRKKVWVHKNFQLKYIFILVTVGLGFSIISGVFSYTYVKVIIDDFVIGNTAATEKRFLVPFLFTFGTISLGFVLILIVIGRTLSHRTAGPLYAFELFVEDLLQGKNRPLKLRAGDEFPHLEEVAESLRQRLMPPEIGDTPPHPSPGEH